MTNGSETGKLYRCQGSQHFIFYPSVEKQKLANIMKLKPVTLPSYCLFVGHGYVQHAGAE